MSAAQAIITTWFVADDAASATFFPQIGSQSDAPESQAVYWRCAACFFASSFALNPGHPHRFYTNTALPVIDGVDFSALFSRWGVEVVTLPITHRLPSGAVSSWGNQFYILDIMAHHAQTGSHAPLIVLDSDCLWIKPVDAMVRAIETHGALTYRIDNDEYPPGSVINGRSEADLARFLAAEGGPALAEVSYCGGEIYAASAALNRALSARAAALWPMVMAQGEYAPLEEAHLLSVLYAAEILTSSSANPFIRRMWTTFHFHNLRSADRDLALWHLPAEKRTGFADLFRRITRNPLWHPARDGIAMGLTQPVYDRLMGYPRRPARKFVRDIRLKLREKLKP